jgi:hypothetical protein
MKGRSSTTDAYEPSVLNRFYEAVARLPGGGWWIYPLLFAAEIAYVLGVLVLTGRATPESFSPVTLAGLVYGPFSLAASQYLFGVAGRAMDAFRPATGLTEEEYERQRLELTTLPANRLLVAVLIGTAIAIGSVVFAAPSALAPYGGTPLIALIVLGPAVLFGYTMFPVVLYQAVHQLRQVDRLHREATRIDPFDTTPIYAFSRFTVQIGLAFVLIGYFSVTVNASFQEGNPVSLAIVGATELIGAACFLLPLWGIHGRLVAEKVRLVRAVNTRAEALQQELYRRVDASTLKDVKEVTDALGGVYATREQVGRLPTWPWPPQVLRGFLSAILLPVVVFLITRFVGSQIR